MHVCSRYEQYSLHDRCSWDEGKSRGRVQGVWTPPLKMTYSFLIQLAFCKIWRYV